MLKCVLSAGLSVVSAQVLAQSGVSVGGTLDVGLRHVRNGSLGSDNSEVSGSNATSKLVVRGTEDLGGGLSAGFYLDGSMLADIGTAGSTAPAGQFWDRRSTVNLSHTRWGELRMGRDWVPTHLVWSGFDPFFALGVASANTFRSFTASRALGQAFGSASESVSANPTLRVSNAVEYFLPSTLGGVYGHLVVTAGEGGTTAQGYTSGEGFRLGWSGRGVNVAAAQFTTRNAAAHQRFQDQVFGASCDFGLARLDVAQRRWTFASDRTVLTQLGAVIPVGKAGELKLTWVDANQSGATAALDANDATLLGAGYVHALSKRTALYVHAARVSNRGSATFTIPGGPAVSANPSAPNFFGGQKSTAVESGLRHNF